MIQKNSNSITQLLIKLNLFVCSNNDCKIINLERLNVTKFLQKHYNFLWVTHTNKILVWICTATKSVGNRCSKPYAPILRVLCRTQARVNERVEGWLRDAYTTTVKKDRKPLKCRTQEEHPGLEVARKTKVPAPSRETGALTS